MMRSEQPPTIFLKDYQPPAYWIDHTDLTVEIGETTTRVKSRLLMRRNNTQPVQALMLDGSELQLQKIAIDGCVLSDDEYAVTEEGLLIHKALNDEFELYCETVIKPQENTSLEGLYQSGGMFCTQCEAQGFRKITYYLDRPDVMSRFTTTIIADKQKYPVLLSNGNEIVRADIGDNQHCVTWEDPFKKPAYLFALVAGDLVYQEDVFITHSGKQVTLRLFVEHQNKDKCDFALSALKKSMRWDEDVYGREYDLDIFMIVAVDHFNMGAMENKGLNIFNSSCVLAKPETTTDEGFERIESIVAHEYFHNWSGNRVTCRDWFQLSLKEGFTVFRDQQFSADMHSPVVARIGDVNVLRTAQFAEDAGPMAHAVRPASYIEISNFYTLTVYEKGAEIVRMLHTLLGATLFRKGTDYYFSTQDGHAATTDDFVAAMEKVSGRDFTQFKRWYEQAGTPELMVRDEYDEKTQQYRLLIEQTCPATPNQTEKKPFHIPLRVGLLSRDGKSMPLSLAPGDAAADEQVLELTQATQVFEFFDVPSKPVPSLLRQFSAPVKLHYHYSAEDLICLMNGDSDGFNRWDANQRLAVMFLQEWISDARYKQKPPVNEVLLSAYRRLLSEAQQTNADYALIARLLTLPSQAYLSELAHQIDVDAIHYAHTYMKKSIAQALKNELLAVYRLLGNSNTSHYESSVAAARSLKNVCLSYLMTLGDKDVQALCLQQFAQALNMSDVRASFSALVNDESGYCDKQQVVTLFYDRWQHDVLVVEQWFATQAASGTYTLADIEKLTTHPAFDISNPNLVRAVIGVFANQNSVVFHQISGAGYAFLASWVLRLDALNPQIAARLLTPLTRWQKHLPQRQALMKAELARILSSTHLSKDVYEIASKSI